MSTRMNSKVGKSAATPNTATHTAGQEVTGPVPATPGTAAGAPTPATASQLEAVVAAAKAFREGYFSLRDALGQALVVLAPVDGVRKPTVSSQRKAATPMLADLLRQHPEIAPLVSPDVIDAGMAAGDALHTVGADIETLLLTVQGGARLATANAWRGASTVYGLARVHAKTDREVDSKLAPVRATLKKGKRTVTASAAATQAEVQAANAQQRASAAQGRVTHARRVHARAVQAHADAHPTVATTADGANPQGPAVNPQGPAPTSAAVLQGPAVNPQGPAPGR